MRQPTALEQDCPVHSTLKGCVNYPGRQNASCEEQLQIVFSGAVQVVHGEAVQSQRTAPKWQKKKGKATRYLMGAKCSVRRCSAHRASQGCSFRVTQPRVSHRREQHLYMDYPSAFSVV